MRQVIILILLTVLCFPAYKALRHPGMIYGHDSESIVFRSIEFRQALRDGHFPVRWSKRLNFGLGQPTFTFSYNLPYYLSAGLGILRINEIWAYKILLAASFPLSAFFAYLWLREVFGERGAVIGGLFYTYVPYHFLNVYVRAAFGEVVAGALVPLVLYGTIKLAKKQTLSNVVFLALGVGMLALSHNMYLVVLLPVLAVYFMTNMTGLTWRGLLSLGVALGLGLGLASYYLIPAYFYKNLTHLSEIGKWFLENNNFVTMKDLLLPRWGFSGLRRDSGEGLMSMQIGWPQVIVVFAAGWLTLKNKLGAHKKRSVLIWILLVGALLMMHKQSLWVWKMVPILQNLQFPWRLMFLVNLATAWMAVVVFGKFKLRQLAIVIAILILANRGYWHVYRYSIWKDPTIKPVGYPGTLTMLLEETPKWHDILMEHVPYHQSQIYSGEANIKNKTWKTNYHEFEVSADSEFVMTDRTHYWPGWKGYVDGNEVKILDPQDEKTFGLITFAVPKGSHNIRVVLKEPLLNKIGDGVSLLTLGLLLLGLLVPPYRRLGIFKKTDHPQL